MIALNDFKKEAKKIKTDLLKACEDVIDSGWYILGNHVKQFEAEFAEHMDCKYAIGISNGLEAIQIALMACGIQKGDEVITTPMSAFATTLAILNAGATPVFVDIDDKTININSELIEEKITDKTKAIIPVHLYGNPCQLDKIMTLCDKYNLSLIEDACQAHAATFDGKKVGNFGKFGCFSFYPTKNLGALGDGGALTTNDEELYKTAMAMRDYGQTTKYHHEIPGLNARLDELQAAILSVKLKHLEANTQRRREIAKEYREGISNPAVSIIETTKNADSASHLFVLRTAERDALMAHLKDAGVMSAIHFPKGLHQQQAYLSLAGLSAPPSLPACEKACNEVLSLPMNPELEDFEIQTVINAVNSF